MGRLIVAGLGPGDIPIFDPRVWEVLHGVESVVFRTEVHPGISSAKKQLRASNPAISFSSLDDLYQHADSFGSLYRQIAEGLEEISSSSSADVLYLVPGSPWVAERSVELLRERGIAELEVLSGVSFLELVWEKIGIDPLSKGITIIDAGDFARTSKLNPGPYLLTQVWSKPILSEVKLSLSDPGDTKATVLKDLGTANEEVMEIEWDDLDRLVEPDHLTSIYIARVPVSPGLELIELYEIIARLRLECPWDREQTHSSLVRHLLEESYEVIDAIEKLDQIGSGQDLQPLFDDLKGELGDLLVQVYFHSNLAYEEGHFDLGQVAGSACEKLVRRHPHVFGDLEVGGSDQVVANWEIIKRSEGDGKSIMDGVPTSMPSLLLAGKLLRKGTAVGFEIPGADNARSNLTEIWEKFSSYEQMSQDEAQRLFAEYLWWLVVLGKEKGIDLEDGLRSQCKSYIEKIRNAETNSI